MKCDKCKWRHDVKDSEGHYLSYCVFSHPDNDNYGERIDGRISVVQKCEHWEISDIYKKLMEGGKL